jgi:phosphoribosylaminoimidazole-succinocarboxamide synthase
MAKLEPISQSLMRVLGTPRQGKAKDIFTVRGRERHLAIVASNRGSTHNVVHRSLFPEKGAILHALTIFWVRTALSHIRNHIIAYGREIYDYLPKGDYHPELHHVAMVVQKQDVSPIEFIWRNYNVGSYAAGAKSGWAEFGGKNPYGYKHGPELPLMELFVQPLFTPTRKSEKDEPIPADYVMRNFPREYEMSKEVHQRLTADLFIKDITLIDSKGEFSQIMMADEWGNGDCCRMTYTKSVAEGVEPPWMDKEIARQEAKKLWAAMGVSLSDKNKPALTFPPDVIRRTMDGYHEAFVAITGQTLAEFQKKYLD